MEKTGAVVSKVETKISDSVIDIKEWILDAENWKKVGATVANMSISLVKGLVFFVESLIDGLTLLSIGQLLPVTLFTGGYDVIKGIATGEFNWSATKGLWTKFKNKVTYSWTDKLFEKIYDTKAGKWLDNYAYSPFKSDATGCKVIEGIGYATGIILISLATAGIGGGASIAGGASGTISSLMPTFSAFFSGIAGFGKYTAEEWNKNDVTIEYNGQQQKLDIDYQKYLEITKLTDGKSTTIKQQVKSEDGSISNITFTITKKGNEYNIIDNTGKQVEFKGITESSTEKGLFIGGIKGGWEGLQYWLGGKIGTGNFSKITENITKPFTKEAVKSAIRVGLDTLTGVVEVPFQTLINAFSEDMSLKEAFEASGGWEAVKIQALIASILSFGGEAFSFKNNVLNSQIDDAVSINQLDDAVSINQIDDAVSINQLDDVALKNLTDSEPWKKYSNKVKAECTEKYISDQKWNLAKQQGIVDNNNNIVKQEEFNKLELSEVDIAAINIKITGQLDDISKKLVAFEVNGDLKSGLTAEDAAKLLLDGSPQENIFSKSFIQNWKDAWGADISGNCEVVTFKSGANFEKYVVGQNALGFDDGEFTMPKSVAEELIAKCTKSDGKIDTALLEKSLSVPEGSFSSGVVQVTQHVNIDDISLPNSNLQGSILGEWLPGGKTRGGITEGIVEHIEKDINGNWVRNKSDNEIINVEIKDYR